VRFKFAEKVSLKCNLNFRSTSVSLPKESGAQLADFTERRAAAYVITLTL
jgi:hypothetical protein